VWSWGDGDYGKLGRGGSDGCKTPKLIEKLQDLDVIKVRCGSQFSIALTKDGQVYSWGKGDNQRLGHGTEEHVRYPKLLEGLQGDCRSKIKPLWIYFLEVFRFLFLPYIQ
jgi:E3 ubiquitin-protein ligase HERC2